MEDIILLIKADAVRIYCGPAVYKLIRGTTARWQNVQFFTLSEADAEDVDRAELFKIESFLEMIRDCSRVGIPLSWPAALPRTAAESSDSSSRAVEVFEVETWPIIQAFGLEGVGSGTFFTLKYAVTDIAPECGTFYRCVDGQSHLYLRDVEGKLLGGHLERAREQGIPAAVEDMHDSLQAVFRHGALRGSPVEPSPFLPPVGVTQPSEDALQITAIAARSPVMAAHVMLSVTSPACQPSPLTLAPAELDRRLTLPASPDWSDDDTAEAERVQALEAAYLSGLQGWKEVLSQLLHLPATQSLMAWQQAERPQRVRLQVCDVFGMAVDWMEAARLWGKGLGLAVQVMYLWSGMLDTHVSATTLIVEQQQQASPLASSQSGGGVGSGGGGKRSGSRAWKCRSLFPTLLQESAGGMHLAVASSMMERLRQWIQISCVSCLTGAGLLLVAVDGQSVGMGAVYGSTEGLMLLSAQWGLITVPTVAVISLSPLQQQDGMTSWTLKVDPGQVKATSTLWSQMKQLQLSWPRGNWSGKEFWELCQPLVEAWNVQSTSTGKDAVRQEAASTPIPSLQQGEKDRERVLPLHIQVCGPMGSLGPVRMSLLDTVAKNPRVSISLQWTEQPQEEEEETKNNINSPLSANRMLQLAVIPACYVESGMQHSQAMVMASWGHGAVLVGTGNSSNLQGALANIRAARSGLVTPHAQEVLLVSRHASQPVAAESDHDWMDALGAAALSGALAPPLPPMSRTSLSYRLHSVHLPVVLERSELEMLISAWLRSHQIVGAEGIIRTNEGCQWVCGLAHGSRSDLNCYDWSAEAAGSHSPLPLDVLHVAVTVGSLSNSERSEQVGEGITLSTLVSELLSCRVRPAQKLGPLSLSDLTPEQWAQVEETSHQVPLPEGIFYNGVFYLDFEGNRFEKRPDLNDIAQEWLQPINAQRAAANQALEQLHAADAQLVKTVMFSNMK